MTKEQPTLRDRFAMAALTGLIAAETWSGHRERAEEAYRVADLMLAVRKEKHGKRTK